MLGLGLGVTDHWEPFHVSISPCDEAGEPKSHPAAVQRSALVHATPRSELLLGPGAGLGVIDQVVPFQVSTSV